MNSLAEMAAQQNIPVEFDADLDRAQEQIGQDVLFLDEAGLTEKVQALNDCQEMLDLATPEQLETLVYKNMARAFDILKRDFMVSHKVFSDPQLRETLRVIGWQWAKSLS